MKQSQNLIISFSQINFCKNWAPCDPRRKIHHVRQWVGVQNGDVVEPAIVAAAPPRANRLLHHVEGRGPRAARPPDDPVQLKSCKLRFRRRQLFLSSWRKGEAMGGPLVSKWCSTPCDVCGRTFERFTTSSKRWRRSWKNKGSLPVEICLTPETAFHWSAATAAEEMPRLLIRSRSWWSRWGRSTCARGGSGQPEGQFYVRRTKTLPYRCCVTGFLLLVLLTKFGFIPSWV